MCPVFPFLESYLHLKVVYKIVWVYEFINMDTESRHLSL